MTTLAQLHDCHSCNDERSIVPKKIRLYICCTPTIGSSLSVKNYYIRIMLLVQVNERGSVVVQE